MHTTTEARDDAATAGAKAVQRGDGARLPRMQEGAMQVTADINPLGLIGLAYELRMLAIDRPHRAEALNALADAVKVAEQAADDDFDALVDRLRGSDWADTEARR